MKKYKTIVMYDASKKKNICKTITLSKFKDESEIDKKIEELKNEQKEKNRLYKENNSIDILNNPIDILNKNDTLDNINNLRLDKNTGNSTVIFGGSKRGKSTLMMKIYKLLYMLDKKFITTLFTGSSQINVYKDSKNLLIGDGFNKQSENYIKMQKYINSHTDNKYKFLNMFDDIVDMKYKLLINQLILTYRNSLISSIMCLQYVFLLSKQNRSNVNNVIIFATNNDESKKGLIDIFLKNYMIKLGYKSYSEMISYFDSVTADYGFFYLDNMSGIVTTHRLKY